MNDSPDFIVIVGQYKATVNPQTLSASRWLFVAMAVDEHSSLCVIDREAVEDIVKLIQNEGWTVTVR